MSLTRSFSALIESTVNSGMMEMYQGMDEMTGTHWKPHSSMDRRNRKRKHILDKPHTHKVSFHK